MELNTIGNKFFEENKDKILGEFSISDFRNTIIVKGNKQEVEQYFDKELNEVPKSIDNNQKSYLKSKEDIINAVTEIASKSKNANEFISLIITRASDWNLDITSNEFVDALELVKGDTEFNKKKLKNIYLTQGLNLKKEKEKDRKEAISEMHVDNIINLAYEANEKNEEEIYNSMPLDDLIKLKKEKYGDIDISLPIGQDERILTNIIAKKFSDINQSIKLKRQNTQMNKEVIETVELVEDVNQEKVLSIEDTVKIYSSNLSDNDIKAFVWYNQTLGLPMYGWNKWYLSNVLNYVVSVNEDVDYYNQQLVNVGKFQAGDDIGKITKFTYVVNGVQSTLVRRLDGQLVYVKTSAIKTQYSTGDIPPSLIPEIVSMVKSYSLYYFNGDYVPLHVYSNTDIDLLKSQLELDKDYIISKFGDMVYQNQLGLLVNNTMRIDAPLIQDRFKLNPFSEIARNTMTEVIGKDGRDDETISVMDAFSLHIDSLKNSDFKLVSKQEFKSIVIYDYKKRFSKNEEDEKEQYKNVVANANIECVRLFSDFCANNLDTTTKTTLNRLINLTYNRSMIVNTSKVPVGFVCNSKFGSADFKLKPVQVEAFKFAVSRNNWCLALTVGFGKTSLAISVLSYFISSGIIKKPLVIVPKPVLSNWLKEMNGYWIEPTTRNISFKEIKGYKKMYGILTDCGIEVLNLRNLDKKYRNIATKYFDENKNEKLITLCTYEALEKMHIGEESIREFVISQWKDILTSSDREDKESAKQWTLKMIQLEEKLNKVDKDAEIDIYKLGFDSMFVDEAHRLKNMFVGVQADKTNRVQSSFKGTSSSRALRGFYISMYLQKQNGRIGFLTATPFSNTPLEVYTMLCFLGYNELCKNNLNKISKFVELFFNETTEPKVNKDNKIMYEAVMKNYKNKPILNTLLSNVFLYKDDPKEAGLERPCIIRYPNNDIKLMLKMSEIQKLQRDILIGDVGSVRDFIETETDEDLLDYANELIAKYQENILSVKERNRGGSIVASSKISALSPFAGSPVSVSFATEEQWSELYYHSPKIRFTIDSIKSMIEYHANRQESSSSFLIYCEVGLNILPYFKEALENICGFRKNISIKEDDDDDDDVKDKDRFDEVEIIEGSADNDKESNRRDKIQTLFNLGKVKVIIGTSTIKEGLNLQTNSATLFILTPSWNSTDINQVEGRIHRQGNRFGYARVITPLVARSLDSFIYQKYDEKKSRLADIWKNDGKSDTEDLNIEIKAEKQKELILDNAKEIAKIRGDMSARQKTNILNKAQEDYEAVKKAISGSSVFTSLCSYNLSKLPEMLLVAENNYSVITKLLLEIESGIDMKSSIKGLKTRLANLIQYYDDLIVSIKKANESKQIVDLVSIINRQYNQRTYDITSNYDNRLDLKEYFVENGYNRNITNNLFVEDIFASIGVYTKVQSYDNNFYQSLKYLKELYAENTLAEKYILEPEGLSLSSNQEDLNALVDRYKAVLDSVIADIEYNFDKIGEVLKPKEDYLLKLQEDAQIELDEENKLSLNSDELGKYFAEKTNSQLSYLKSDVDLSRCEIKYEECCDTNGEKEIVEYKKTKTETVSQKTEMSKFELIALYKSKLESIKYLIPNSQYSVMKKAILEFKTPINELISILDIMPQTREQDGFGYNAFVMLHYFTGGTDVYITELDNGYTYGFGFTILNGDYQNAEWGYIDVSEFKTIASMNLDLYFTPKPLIEILNEKGLDKEAGKIENTDKYLELQNKINAIYGKEIIEPYTEPISAEKQSLLDEIQSINELMELVDGDDLDILIKEKQDVTNLIELL